MGINIGFSPKDLVTNVVSAPFEIGGKAVDAAGAVAGKGIDVAGDAASWGKDRVTDAANLDPFGTDRRRDEALRAQNDKILEGQTANKSEIDALRTSLMGDSKAPDGVMAASAGATCSMGAFVKAAGMVDDKDAPGPRGALGTHLVSEGETLGGIAESKGKTVEDLLKVNPDITDANQLSVGQTIKIDDLAVGEKPTESLARTANQVTKDAPSVGAELEA